MHETHPLHREPYSGWKESMWGDTSHVGPHTPLLTQLPALEWVSVEARDQATQRVYLRLYSQLPCWAILNMTGPSLVRWSFTDMLSPSKICSVSMPYVLHADLALLSDQCVVSEVWGACHTHARSLTAWAVYDMQACGNSHQYVVRLVHQDSDPFVGFWVDLDTSKLAGQASEGSSAFGPLGLRIETSVSYIQRTPQLQQVLRQLPPFLTETWLATVYQSVLKV